MNLLKKHNIKTPKSKTFKINEKLNFDTFPCVLDKNIHKSDIGGVITGINSNEELIPVLIYYKGYEYMRIDVITPIGWKWGLFLLTYTVA